MILILLATHAAAFASDPQTDFLQANRSTYSSKGNPIAKGVDFSIQYPQNWTKRKSGKADSVARWAKKYSNDFLSYTIAITDIPAGQTAKQILDIFDDKARADSVYLPPRARLVASQRLEVGGNPAFVIFSISSSSHNSTDLRIANQTCTVLFKDKVIYLTSIVAYKSTDADPVIIKRFEPYKKLFDEMYDTVTIN